MGSRELEIPIVFTPDENFMVPTCIAILSMLRSKQPDSIYRFFLVVSDKIDKSCLKYLDRVKELEKNFNYQIKYINSDMFDNQKITLKHISTSTYYRLILADVLQEYDKCMYHDGDILVNEDLKAMYNIELDDFYIAGIRAIDMHQNSERNSKLINILGIPSSDNYIFAGDLIFNLLNIRINGITDEFIEQMGFGYPSQDQDVINRCCYGKIYFLPLKFCMPNRWINNDYLESLDKQVYDTLEMEEARRKPAIVHFMGDVAKPWCNLRSVYSDSWWNFARELLQEEEYRQWYNIAEEKTNERDWKYLRERLEADRSVMIFGCGENGLELCKVLRRWNHKVECFIDNNVEKQGLCFETCKVLDVQTAVHQFKEVAIVNTVQRFRKDIKMQLLNLGVSESKIIDYYAKDHIYYMSLDEKYFEYEFRDMCIKNYGWEPKNSGKKYIGNM